MKPIISEEGSHVTGENGSHKKVKTDPFLLISRRDVSTAVRILKNRLPYSAIVSIICI
jgi:hypothetical protein